MSHVTSAQALRPHGHEVTQSSIGSTKKTLRKIISKFPLRRANSSSSPSEGWNSKSSAAISIATSQPPSYDRVRILDGYKWPLREPIEILMTCDELWPHSRFSCQITDAALCCPNLKQNIYTSLMTLPCGHTFHSACIHTQLRRSVYARCPTCQHTLHHRLCHHRIHIPYFTPGSAISPTELDGACRSCAPFPFMQRVLKDRGPATALPESDRAFFDVDFGWHWWILSVLEGGAERYFAERAALLYRLFRVCAGQDEEERRAAILVFDTLRLVYLNLKVQEGIDWHHALILLGPVDSGQEATLFCDKTLEERGVDVWRHLLDVVVERFHAFHIRGTRLWEPQQLLPFQPYHPMIEDLADGSV